MADADQVQVANVFDGVAGAELVGLEAWLKQWFVTNLSKHFETVERWRGQITPEAIERTSFKAPALFFSCLGSDGRAVTSGARTMPGVHFGAAVVAKNSSSEKNSRYSEGLAKASIMWRALHTMTPERDAEWQRPTLIRFKNNYSKKLDKMGLALYDFSWIHPMSLGNIDISKLDDFATLFGQIFPDDPTQTTLPTEGEVVFPPE